MSDPSRAVSVDRIAQAIAAVPYFAFLGLQARLVGDEVVVVLAAAARHIGDAGRSSLHGGVLAAFLEAAAHTHLRVRNSGVPMTTVEFTTAFVREAAVGDTFASVCVVRVGRHFAHVRVDAWQGDRASAVAIGHGTFSRG